MSDAAVEVRSLAYAYPDGQAALRDVSFSLQAGTNVGLIGGNGAGKSTLLLHLNGVLQGSSGEVRVHGLTVSASNLIEVRRQLGMVFQDADDQLFMPTVEDDVAFGPRNMGLSDAEVQRRVTQALATVGATHLASRAPYRLSGGEKALTAIALVFSMFQLNPAPFCLLDEVDAPLDDSNTERFCAMVKKMSANTQFLFISHNKISMEMAEQLVGVTMQESGVSRVVEVDIEEALKMRDVA